MASFSAHKEMFVEVTVGHIDRVLGDMSGWKGRVVRQFSTNNVQYYDVELSAETLNSLTKERRQEYERKRICFTRFRINSNSTRECEMHEQAAQRMKAYQRVQSEWFSIAGSSERDLTRERSDDEYSYLQDPSKRQFIQAMALLGIGALVIFGAAAECSDDGATGGGSWGRVGGGYYG